MDLTTSARIIIGLCLCSNCMTSPTTTEQPQLSPDHLDTINNDVFSNVPKIYHETVIGQWICWIWWPTIIPIGTIGNILSFLVMTQKHNRSNSCCTYMAGLALSDIAMLWLCLYDWLTNLPYPWARQTLVMCKVNNWAFQALSMNSIILVTFMTLDRFVAVSFPFKAKRWCTTKRAKVTMIIILIVTVTYALPYYFRSGLVDGTACVIFIVKDQFSTIYSWVVLFINSVCPFSIIFILNVKIIKVIQTRNQSFQEKETSGGGSSDDGDKKDKDSKTSSKDIQLTIMLLCVSFMLLALTIPVYTRHIVYIFIDKEHDEQTYARFILAYFTTLCAFYSNNACNFFLYCIAGSKFRDDLKKLFKYK